MKMYIGGKPVDARNKAVMKIINPATGKVIDTVPNATPEDVDRAVKIEKILITDMECDKLQKLLKKNGQKFRCIRKQNF